MNLVTFQLQVDLCELLHFEELKCACSYAFINSVTLTVSGDVNAHILCDPMFKLVHTGQVLPFVKGQRELISQPATQGVSIRL